MVVYQTTLVGLCSELNIGGGTRGAGGASPPPQVFLFFFIHLFILGEFSVHIWDTGFQNRPVNKRLQINNFTHYYLIR